MNNSREHQPDHEKTEMLQELNRINEKFLTFRKEMKDNYESTHWQNKLADTIKSDLKLATDRVQIDNYTMLPEQYPEIMEEKVDHYIRLVTLYESDHFFPEDYQQQ